MKKYIFLPLSILGTSLFAQFTINGQIDNYNSKPVLVKIFDNGHAKIIQNAKTDPNGHFVAKVPVTYNGLIKLEMPAGGSINILSDNENIKFKTSYGQNIQQDVQVLEGKTQIEYNALQKLAPLKDLNTNLLPHLKKVYQPSDAFYKAIEAEQDRITKLTQNQTFNSSLVKYINDLESILSETKNNATITNETANKILAHIEKDDNRLEHSGMLQELVYAYINYQFTQNQGKTPETVVMSATEVLLEKGNIETERGQNVLSTLFSLIPESNFENFHSTYKSKVNALTCKVTDDLKSKVKSETLKIGNKAPDIKFESAVKGKKSLYDIKANQKLVVFWASWCPACNKEMPYIKEYYNEFKKNGGEIIAISLDYDQTMFNDATKELPWFNYTDLMRWDSPIAASYQVEATPTIFLLDKDNKIINKVSHINELIQTK
ncbi:TlpA disulfide reductase family protein [Faecalibacter sp. LW9]|uniref:TlpA disulfide reductase family protein n=1 Tax=Faecalibacter sp. LW9 TaxID=3103144 RepID=UPI002AFF49BA|nr:TlpA disulfide reductase family protein [Faecalibacter sp. LW9]